MVLLVLAPSASAGWHDGQYNFSGQPRRGVVRVPLKVPTASQLQALALNRSVPTDPARIVPASPTILLSSSISGLSRLSAIDCLTAAVYYEAANEPVAGQRAVAQIILNRSRHPTFPNSVCGVVFQGAERVTGCQFTFTCDGSLRRMPSISGWQRAKAVALAALSGYVERSVGHATHYHADYVRPYWAPSLVKLNHLGSHIFYVWPGRPGNSAAFNQSLSMSETFPTWAALALSGYLIVGDDPDAIGAATLATSGIDVLPSADASTVLAGSAGPIAPLPPLTVPEDTGLIQSKTQLALPETRLRETHQVLTAGAGGGMALKDQ